MNQSARILVAGLGSAHGDDQAGRLVAENVALQCQGHPDIIVRKAAIPQVAALRNSVGENLRARRDATRGGVSAVLHEWAQECGHTFELTESRIPVTENVRGACELPGLDPLYVANEGTIVVAIDHDKADVAVNTLRQLPGCERAMVIGEVRPKCLSPVTIRRTFGSPQPLDEPSGAPLPRIC